MTSRLAGAARGPHDDHDDHDDHDRELIAAFAAGDASQADRIRAEALSRECEPCRLLAEDLRLIAAAIRQLPAPAPLTRDYQLYAAAALRLRGGRWQRLSRALGLSSWNPRPFAAALTTLGVAGLLIAVLPFMSLGSGAAAPDAAG